jgi:signal transduction histidine kinase
VGLSPQAALAVALLAVATTVPLALLGPAAAALAVCAAALVSLTAFHTLTVAGAIGVVLTLHVLGRDGSQPLAAVLAMPYLVLALVAPYAGEARVLTVLLAALAPISAWSGIARRARSQAAQHRAAEQVVASTLLDHTARGERARIARELHDVVAHHISVIAVQAETARLTTPDLPPAGAKRFAQIGDTARAGLIEMRRLLGVLREDAAAAEATRADAMRAGAEAEPRPDTAAAPRQPQPGLAQLNDLVDSARDTSGAGVRLILRGLPVAVDPGVELVAYRIVQEALTNARRHAPGAAVDVELHYTDHVLRLRVRDNGPGPPSTERPGGHGLLGMRERVAAVGGRIGTGRAPGGGFVVDATLPAKTEALG